MKRVIALIYLQVRAPAWAALNLDALADVLRDLSWLPPGPVQIAVPGWGTDALPAGVRRVLARAVEDTAGTERPVHLRLPEASG